MAIVAFNFNKISVERKGVPRGKINIKNNISIKDVQKADLSLGKAKQAGLRFIFEYVSKYDPNVGEVKLEGDVLDLEEEKKVKEILDGWKKNKKLPQDLTAAVINNVLNKCNIQALVLSKEVNLPPPINLPRVGVKK